MIDGAVREQDFQSVLRPESVEDLFGRYEKPEFPGWLVKFHRLREGVTAYNSSKVFKVGGVPHMLVRQEEKGARGEFTSELAIWECSEDGKDCYPAPISNLAELTAGKVAQDPSIAYVKDKWVVTWVEAVPHPEDPTKDSTYKSVIAIGSSLDKLELLTEEIIDHDQTVGDRNVELAATKGLRFERTLDGRIAFTTRTVTNGEYKMCFGVADTWDDITTETLNSAKEIKGLEGLIVNGPDDKNRRWIGPNDLQLLANGDISLLFHVARFEENGIPGNRVYDVAHCIITLGEGEDPAQAKYLKIIARAEDFNIPVEVLPPKRPDLARVSYPSCLLIARDRRKKSILLAALRDAGEVGQEITGLLNEWLMDHPEYADNPFPPEVNQLPLAA